jgi:vanillate/4-hydroxybenzoate decarboxylase subunit C
MKCYNDFREFLAVLDQAGQLLRINDEVKFEPDLVPAGAALAQIGDAAPAILFDKIAGCIDAQVAMNVHGYWPNHSLALGMDKETSLKE